MAAVGVVTRLVGTVTATDPRGHVRILNEGDPVAQNDVIACERGASVHIEFIRSGYITLGGGDQVHLTEDLVRHINTSSQKSANAQDILTDGVASQDVLDIHDLIEGLDSKQSALYFQVKTIGNEKVLTISMEESFDHSVAPFDGNSISGAVLAPEVLNVLTQLEQPNMHFIG